MCVCVGKQANEFVHRNSKPRTMLASMASKKTQKRLKYNPGVLNGMSECSGLVAACNVICLLRSGGRCTEGEGVEWISMVDVLKVKV